MWILCSFIGEALKKRAHIPHNFEMSFGTNTSGYREQEMRRQSPVLIGVSLSPKTDVFEMHETAGFDTTPQRQVFARRANMDGKSERRWGPNRR
jgi:hypothetical protein